MKLAIGACSELLDHPGYDLAALARYEGLEFRSFTNALAPRRTGSHISLLAAHRTGRSSYTRS